MRKQWQAGHRRAQRLPTRRKDDYCRPVRLKTHTAVAKPPLVYPVFSPAMTQPAPSSIDPALLQAYRETDYMVHAQPHFVLHIDQPSAALAAYFQHRGINAGCVMTAWNPYSQPLSNAENQARQARLEQALQQAGWQWVRAVGSHPRNAWPPEVGCFVEGMGEAAAGEWGRTCEQNAVVWCGADAISRLRLLR